MPATSKNTRTAFHSAREHDRTGQRIADDPASAPPGAAGMARLAARRPVRARTRGGGCPPPPLGSAGHERTLSAAGAARRHRGLGPSGNQNCLCAGALHVSPGRSGGIPPGRRGGVRQCHSRGDGEGPGAGVRGDRRLRRPDHGRRRGPGAGRARGRRQGALARHQDARRLARRSGRPVQPRPPAPRPHARSPVPGRGAPRREGRAEPGYMGLPHAARRGGRPRGFASRSGRGRGPRRRALGRRAVRRISGREASPSGGRGCCGWRCCPTYA